MSVHVGSDNAPHSTAGSRGMGPGLNVPTLLSQAVLQTKSR